MWGNNKVNLDWFLFRQRGDHVRILGRHRSRRDLRESRLNISSLRMLVVMANHAASQGTYVSVGKSAVWAPGAALLAEAPVRRVRS